MKTRLLVASLFLASSLFAQNFTNARVTTVDARGGVAQAIGNRSGWVAWSVPMAADGQICCWTDKGSGCCGGCTLGGNRGWSINSNRDGLRYQGSGDVVIAVRIGGGGIDKVQMFDSGCPIDGRGHDVQWLANVDPASSIAYLASQSEPGPIAQHAHPSAIPALERLAGRGNTDKVRGDALFWIGQRGGERGYKFLHDFIRADESTSLRKKAVFALSQNDSEGAVPALIEVARHSDARAIRREAIFWLGQRAGAKAAEELRRVVDEDPDDDVREHAVFAISQLPRERSVPLLADLAKNHKSAAVRKKALFWLAQSGDDRAIDVIEEILKK